MYIQFVKQRARLINAMPKSFCQISRTQTFRGQLVQNFLPPQIKRFSSLCIGNNACRFFRLALYGRRDLLANVSNGLYDLSKRRLFIRETGIGKCHIELYFIYDLGFLFIFLRFSYGPMLFLLTRICSICSSNQGVTYDKQRWIFYQPLELFICVASKIYQQSKCWINYSKLVVRLIRILMWKLILNRRSIFMTFRLVMIWNQQLKLHEFVIIFIVLFVSCVLFKMGNNRLRSVYTKHLSRTNTM